MSREVHVRFWESAAVKSRRATQLPLYRQEEIYARSGVPLARSTMAEWVGACGVKLQPLGDGLKTLLLKRAVLHADETPMPTLRPGLKKTHRSYLWAYGTTPYDPDPIVIYDFALGRSGEHARAFLGAWRGKLVCDDFSGYKALFEGDEPAPEVGCMAHARRKFYELFSKHQSQIAGEALEYQKEQLAISARLTLICRGRGVAGTFSCGPCQLDDKGNVRSAPCYSLPSATVERLPSFW
jgi:hypothetical protein